MVYTINRTLPTYRPLPDEHDVANATDNPCDLINDQCYWWNDGWNSRFLGGTCDIFLQPNGNIPLIRHGFWGKFFHSDGFDRFLPHDPKTFKCSHRHLQMKVKSCISLGVAVFYIPTNTLWIIMNHDWLVSIKIGFPVENENLLALDTGWSRTWFPEKKWRWMVIFPMVPIWATHHPRHKSSTGWWFGTLFSIYWE